MSRQLDLGTEQNALEQPPLGPETSLARVSKEACGNPSKAAWTGLFDKLRELELASEVKPTTHGLLFRLRFRERDFFFLLHVVDSTSNII